MKYFFVIGYAIFLDGLQAGISFALAGLFATPAAIPLIGPFIAAATVPLGIVLGFVINICLSLSIGAGLILALVHICGWNPVQRYLFGAIGDLIPGVNNLPFWTLLAIAASWQHASQKGERAAVKLAVGAAVAPTRTIMSVKEGAMNSPEVQKTIARFGYTQERVPQPVTREDFTQTARARIPMQDIRPTQKPNVQPA